MTPERYVAVGAALALACGVGISGRFARRRFGSVVEPLTAFILSWCVALALFAIPWVRFTRSSLDAWLAAYGAIACFIAGAVLAYRLRPRRAEPAERANELINPARLRAAILACLVLTWIGFAGFLHAVDKALGWQAIFTHPELVRAIESSNAFASSYRAWSVLACLGAIGFLLWTVGLRLRVFEGRSRWMVIGGFLTLCPYFFTADRVQFVTAVLWTGLFHLVWRPLPRLRRVAAVGAVTLLACFAVFTVLGNRRGTTIARYPDIYSRLTTQHFRSLALPYLYVTSGISLFTKLEQDPNRPHTYGAMAFLPLVQMASVAGIGGKPPPEVAAFYPIPFQTENLTSWLGPLYLDYGLAGCLILPLIYGGAVALLASACLRRRTFLGAWLLALAILVSAATPAVDKFGDLAVWELAILGLLIAPFLTNRALPRWSLMTSRFARTSLRVRAAGVVAAVGLCSAAGVALARGGTASQNLANESQLRGALVTAGRKAARAFEQFGYLHPWTLASQLHVADPAITYQALDRDQVPTGTVGIWTSRSATDLRATSFQGQTIELTELNAGSDPRAIGPRLASGLLVNGDFQAPLDSTWMLARGSVATVALDRSALRGHAVLRVAGSGRDGSATTLTQRLLGAPTLPRRLRYRLRLRYRTRALNRPLAIYVKVVHGNGTYQLFGGHDPERPATPGIPSGTARSWRSFEADATVSDPLATIIVVLVDTGTHPLRGTVWIAGPSLEVR